MKKTLVLLAAVSMIAVPAMAGHHEGAEEAGEEAMHEGHGEMSADDAAMMEAWMKAGTPGEQHAKMAKHTGTWDAEFKMWMKPDTEPMMSKGVAERTMMLGGRVMAEKYTSEMMGMPFEGHGMMGYDNVTGKYWSTWNDNMSTTVGVSWGEMNEDGVIVYHSEMPTPDGKMVKQKMKVKMIDENNEHIEMWSDYGDGGFKAMEIHYTRRQ